MLPQRWAPGSFPPSHPHGLAPAVRPDAPGDPRTITVDTAAAAKWIKSTRRHPEALAHTLQARTLRLRSSDIPKIWTARRGDAPATSG